MRAAELQREIDKCLEGLKQLKETNDEFVELVQLLAKAKGLDIVTCTRAEIEPLMYGLECLYATMGDIAAAKEMEYNNAKSYLEYMKASKYLAYTDPKPGQPKYTQEKAKNTVIIDLYQTQMQVNMEKFLYSTASNTWKSLDRIVSVFQSLLKNR